MMMDNENERNKKRKLDELTAVNNNTGLILSQEDILPPVDDSSAEVASEGLIQQ
jgi:hypothetical protein